MSDQRLSVTFGAFSCDVVGYDDPFAILTRVVELFGEIAKSNPAFGAGEVPMSDIEKAKLAAGLGDQATRIDELADKSAPNGMRYVVSNSEDAGAERSDDLTGEDEVVIAAQADETPGGGDLELRDTLAAVGSTEPAPEEEVVALDLAPTPAPILSAAAEEEITPEAPLELTKAVETPVAAAPQADSEEASGAEPVAAESAVANLAEEPFPLEKTVADTADEAPRETEDALKEKAAADIAKTTAAAFAALSETETDSAPVRQPLRLNIGGNGLEPAKPLAAVEAPKADDADEEPEKPQRRVTITKLPLRPVRPKDVEQPDVRAKHSLTPVHKVEPVVTFSPNFGDSADEAPTPSRAERIRAKMELREVEDDDDGENFLFSDVDEVQQPDAPVDAVDVDEEQAPLILGAEPADAPAPQDVPAKKPRRSFANLLGFGKTPAVAPDPAADAPAAETQAENDYAGGADGFVRLRESVTAALPTADDATVSFPAKQSQPESISEAIDYDDETSPTAFARRVGANSLQDLLEASAVYMDVVEGKSRFSRRDVMQALNQIGAENDYTQEARLKSFRKLLTTGSLVRVDDGMFTLSQATRFGYETRMQA